MDTYIFITEFLIVEVVILHWDNALIIIKFPFSSINNSFFKVCFDSLLVSFAFFGLVYKMPSFFFPLLSLFFCVCVLTLIKESYKQCILMFSVFHLMLKSSYLIYLFFIMVSDNRVLSTM